MAASKKQLSVARLNDAVLGAFSRVGPSDTLDHLLRYLGTWSGTDKFLMVIQFTAKLLIPALHLRARLQHRAGWRKTDASASAASLAKLAGIIGDARTLFGIWGILPIFQWLIALERNPPPTRALLTLERLQGWAMLAFYPLDHLRYLVSHAIVPASVPSLIPLPRAASAKPAASASAEPARTKLDPARLGLYSCRLWTFYIALQLLHLREDLALLRARARAVRKAKATGAAAVAEHAELRRRWDTWLNELVCNLSNLPLALHWSLEKGLIGDTSVAVFGFVAAVASFRAGWRATALPPAEPAPATTVETAVAETQTTVHIKITSPLDDPSAQLDALAVPPLAADAAP